MLPVTMLTPAVATVIPTRTGLHPVITVVNVVPIRPVMAWGRRIVPLGMAMVVIVATPVMAVIVVALVAGHDIHRIALHVIVGGGVVAVVATMAIAAVAAIDRTTG